MELWAGRRDGFSNLSIAMDLTWMTLGKSLTSLGLFLQPVCALRGLFCKAVFEFGGSTQLLWQWCIMATRWQATSSPQKFVDKNKLQKGIQGSYLRAHYKMSKE